MQEKKEDLRVRRTKKLLSNALFDLIKKKPFDKISVCDICEEAMIHRATFYSHFSDKYELLTYSLDEHIPLNKIDAPTNSENGMSQIADDIIKSVCENKQIYVSILKKNNEFSISDRIQELLEEKICNKIKNSVKNCEMLSIKPEFLASFYAGACLSVVIKWIVDDISLSAEELMNNLNTLLTFSPDYMA